MVYCGRVCLSVSLSVTYRYFNKTAKHRITQTMPYNSPEILVSDDKNFREITTVLSSMGAPNRGDVGYSR